MKIFILLFLTYSISSLAFAEGGMASGGGKGIVCFENIETTQAVRQEAGQIFDEQLSLITSIETLDYKYSQLASGLGVHKNTIVPLNLGENFNLYLDKILNRVKLTIPDLYEHIIEVQNEFNGNDLILRESPLKPIFDGL